MRKSSRLRVFGSLTVSAVIAIICWLLLPIGEAQENQKLSNVTEKEGTIERPTVDNTDDILLNAGTINVTAEKARALDEKDSLNAREFGGERLHLVRFNGPIKSAWVDSLKVGNLKIVDYIPNYTYLVWGDSNSIESVRSAAKSAASPIEWEGRYKPEYRISPSVRVDVKDETAGLRSDRFEIQLFKDEDANRETLKSIESLRRSEIIGMQEIKHYVNFVVGLDADGVRQVAEMADVISIHPYIEPRKFDEAQSLILRGNLNGNLPTPGDYLSYLLGKGFTQTQFDASNFAVDVTDSGVGNANPANENQFMLRRQGDPAQASRVIYSRLEGTPNTGSTLAGCDGHGNINATIIGGYVPSGGIFAAAPHADANGYRYGLGIAPFVKVGSSVIFDPDSFTNPNVGNLQARAYNDGARISSNSWGSSTAGSYTSTSQAYDFLVRDAQQSTSVFPTVGNQEMVVIFAAGNDGSGAGTMGSPGTAKNLITVGASENVRAFGGSDGCGLPDSAADSANDIIGFSSRGPTTDGRRKPDIVLPGTHVTGGVAQNTLSNPVAGTGTVLPCYTTNDPPGVCGGVGSRFFPAGQQWYTASSGTSHSTPAIAGLAALIRQHFINTAPIGGSPGTGTVPSPALTKALMMNTASYMNGSGANDNLPSNNQGMGLADLDSYFDIFAQSNIIRNQLGADTFTDSGQERVFVGTIANNAKPFRVTVAYSDAPGSTTGNAFVNNLDLEVVIGGNVYKGNNFFKGDSITGGTADPRNNVESVFLPAGTAGNFLVRVKATNLAGDGLPGNADSTDQDFALVVWNGNETAASVVAGGAAALTAESCAINGAIDPSETVTADFDITNFGTAATSNLVATLLPTGGVSAPSAPQAYGALAPGATTNRSFTFTATTSCGQTLTASLQLQDGATNLGVATYNFLTGALAAPSSTSATTGNLTTAITDNNTVQIPIQVSGTGALSDLNVKVRLNHAFDGDLQLSITSPGGVTVPLAGNRGGGGDNFGSGANDCTGTFSVFDDGAPIPISAGTAPFAGSFRPESPLSILNGQSITGTWLLNVADTAAGDLGTVGCAQLEIQRQRYVCCGVPGSPEVVNGGAPVLLSESFVPLNGVPDPGETVTYNIPVLNVGDGATTNLVATLQNSGGITPVTTSRNYGLINPASPAVVRPFTFIANGPCGGSVTATFQLHDGPTNHGTFSYTFQLGTSSANSQTFTNPANITIPDSGTGSLYPSNITVAGAPTSISSATVTLNGFSHSFPADVDILLVSPTGRKFVLFSDSGGGTDAVNANVTFDDAAPGPPSSVVTGTFKPANSGTGDAFASPAPGEPYLSPAPAGTETLTTAFTGATGGNPNGTWSLYVVDDAGGDLGGISGGWSLTLTSLSQTCSSTPGGPERAVRADFDGDGRTDLSIWRPTNGEWWAYQSTAGVMGATWGLTGDKPISADFSGDKKADFGIVRPGVPNQSFWLLDSSAYGTEGFPWGVNGDVPLAGDFNGDGQADVAAYNYATNMFHVLIRGSNEYRGLYFGGAGDIPLAADFDGDGATDIGVYRPSTGVWYFAPAVNPIDNFGKVQFGLSTDKPVPADYDGDGADDIAVYRPSTGQWIILYSETVTIGIVNWGNATDIPVPGDYDGDGNYDVAIYRSGTWWIFGSQAGPLGAAWGLPTDVPVPSMYFAPSP